MCLQGSNAGEQLVNSKAAWHQSQGHDTAAEQLGQVLGLLAEHLLSK